MADDILEELFGRHLSTWLISADRCIDAGHFEDANEIYRAMEFAIGLPHTINMIEYIDDLAKNFTILADATGLKYYHRLRGAKQKSISGQQMSAQQKGGLFDRALQFMADGELLSAISCLEALPRDDKKVSKLLHSVEKQLVNSREKINTTRARVSRKVSHFNVGPIGRARSIANAHSNMSLIATSSTSFKDLYESNTNLSSNNTIDDCMSLDDAEDNVECNETAFNARKLVTAGLTAGAAVLMCLVYMTLKMAPTKLSTW